MYTAADFMARKQRPEEDYGNPRMNRLEVQRVELEAENIRLPI